MGGLAPFAVNSFRRPSICAGLDVSLKGFKRMRSLTETIRLGLESSKNQLAELTFPNRIAVIQRAMTEVAKL